MMPCRTSSLPSSSMVFTSVRHAAWFATFPGRFWIPPLISISDPSSAFPMAYSAARLSSTPSSFASL